MQEAPTQSTCSESFSGIMDLMRSALPKVHVDSCCRTRTLVKTSKSLNLLGSSSSPKGFR